MKEPTMTEFERAAYDITQRLAYVAKKEGQELKPVVLAGLFEYIKTALTSHARPAAGFIREATGPDRKVLGTLSLTKDGCVVGRGAKVWGSYWGGPPGELAVCDPHIPSNPWEGALLVGACHSTREAAEAARLTPAAAQAERGEVADG